ncbi:MAG: LL-diaminopimelate aminotransferase [bacterium]
MIRKAKRLDNIPPYLFAEIDKKKEEAIKRGVKVLNLGIGDPDLPTPPHIVDALYEAAKITSNQKYPPYEGTKEFRKAVVEWFERRFNVSLDPEKEVIALIGSKEGIAHIFLSFVDPGDITLIPDPGYPVYKVATILAGGIPYTFPLKPGTYLPDFSKIPEEVARKARLLFLNYPNNPTAGVADLSVFEEAVEFAKRYDIIICHDNAYSEVTFDGFVAPSILEVKGAKDIAIEFHSLSKTYNMTGWRIGYAVGNREIIEGLSIVKTNVDSGVFMAIQSAGVTALKGPQNVVEENKRVISKRRDIFIEGLKRLGWNISPTKGTFYLWVSIPKNFSSSIDFAGFLLDKTGIVVPPGIGYGENGEGYFRIALTVEESVLREALKRMEEAGIRGD